MLTERQLVSFLPNLKAIARGYERATPHRDELVQIAAERIWLKRDKFAGDDTDARRWMSTVAINLFINHKRAQKRDPLFRAGTIEPLRDINGADPERPDIAYNDIGVDARAETIIEAKRALAAVKRHRCGSLVLFVAGDGSRKRAAKHFGVPVGTVNSQLARAREAIRSAVI